MYPAKGVLLFQKGLFSGATDGVIFLGTVWSALLPAEQQHMKGGGHPADWADARNRASRA